MKKGDKILIVCIMIVAVVLCVPLFFSKNENVYASVYVKEKQVLRIDLSKDKTYVVNGKLGKVHIEVKQKKVRGKMENVYKQYADDCLKNVSKIDTSRIVVADSGGISGDVLSYILGLIEGKARFDEIIRADAGCTISSHCGPKTLAIFYIKK